MLPGNKSHILPFDTKTNNNPINKPVVQILYSTKYPTLNPAILCALLKTIKAKTDIKAALNQLNKPTIKLNFSPPHSLKDIIKDIIITEIIKSLISEGVNL